MKRLIILISICTMISNNDSISATELKENDVKEQLSFFQKYVKIPSEYNYQSAKKVTVDNESAILFRYEKFEKKGLGHEHYSFLVTDKSPLKILGFTNMDVSYSQKKMISKDQTKIIAENFLKEIDPNLSSSLNNQWIDQHDETIIVNDKNVTVSGMKYKCYNKQSKNYAWVIVGHDGSIITFERDIIWSTGMQARVTNKWLHDTWLEEKMTIKD